MGEHLKSAQFFISHPASSGTSCLGSAVMAPVALPTTRVATAAVWQSPAHPLLLEGRSSRGCGLVGRVLDIIQDALGSCLVSHMVVHSCNPYTVGEEYVQRGEPRDESVIPTYMMGLRPSWAIRDHASILKQKQKHFKVKLNRLY